MRKLWVFGSILTNRFNDNSDIDLCVDFDRENIPLMDSVGNFFDFQYALESLLGRKVDLTDDSRSHSECIKTVITGNILRYKTLYL